MTSERLAELRAIAEKATPGKWEAHHGGGDGACVLTDHPDAGGKNDRHVACYCFRMDLSEGEDEADADHIAAFDPPTALALLAELDRLSRTVDHKDEQMAGMQEELERMREQLTMSRAMYEAGEGYKAVKDSVVSIAVADLKNGSELERMRAYASIVDDVLTTYEAGARDSEIDNGPARARAVRDCLHLIKQHWERRAVEAVK